jgi:hypothetical protein
MKNIFKITTVVEFIIIIILASILFLELTHITASRKEIFINNQTEGINYNSYDPYSLFIIEKKVNFYSKPEYELWITKSGNEDYGYMIEYPAGFDLKEGKVQNSKVTWTQEGIEFENNGLKIFIPKEKFIGGR